jgi:hypothetical protein
MKELWYVSLYDAFYCFLKWDIGPRNMSFGKRHATVSFPEHFAPCFLGQGPVRVSWEEAELWTALGFPSGNSPSSQKRQDTHWDVRPYRLCTLESTGVGQPQDKSTDLLAGGWAQSPGKSGSLTLCFPLSGRQWGWVLVLEPPWRLDWIPRPVLEVSEGTDKPWKSLSLLENNVSMGHLVLFHYKLLDSIVGRWLSASNQTGCASWTGVWGEIAQIFRLEILLCLPFLPLWCNLRRRQWPVNEQILVFGTRVVPEP